MKALVRWSATLGLVGSTLLGTVFAGSLPVLALPEKQVKEALDSVPVFVLTNPQGGFLTATLPQGQNGQKPGTVTQVFMNGQEAQTFLEQLRSRKDQDPKTAEIVKSLQVTPVPLGLIYQQLKETAKKPDRLLFAFKPGKQEVDGALALLRQSGQQVQQFPSVPVFIVRSPAKGYISVKRKADNKDVFPIYFSQKDAQSLLSQVKSQDPKAEIQVVDIDGIVKTLQDKNDAWLNQIFLVPSSETLEYINKQLGSNTPKPNAAPNAPKPSAAPSGNNSQPAKPNQR